MAPTNTITIRYEKQYFQLCIPSTRIHITNALHSTCVVGAWRSSEAEHGGVQCQCNKYAFTTICLETLQTWSSERGPSTCGKVQKIYDRPFWTRLASKISDIPPSIPNFLNMDSHLWSRKRIANGERRGWNDSYHKEIIFSGTPTRAQTRVAYIKFVALQTSLCGNMPMAITQDGWSNSFYTIFYKLEEMHRVR